MNNAIYKKLIEKNVKHINDFKKNRKLTNQNLYNLTKYFITKILKITMFGLIYEIIVEDLYKIFHKNLFDFRSRSAKLEFHESCN